MKILQISHRVPFPLNEGGTIGIYNYTRGFAEAGCEVTLYCLDAQKHRVDEQLVRAALEPYCKLSLIPIDTSLKPLHALWSLINGSSYNAIRFHDKAFAQALALLLAKERFDLIQIEGTYAAFYGEIARKLGNCAVVLRQHNVEYQIWERQAANTFNPLKRWYLRVLARRLKKYEANHLNDWDALIPVTEEDAALFREMGCKITVFPSPAGIDTNYWKPSEEGPNSNRIYHLGSMEWAPNVDAMNWFLENVWPGVYALNPHLSLHIAGKGMDGDWLNRQIPGVFMDGEVADAAEFVRDKACCVVPLRSGSGIRLKILEAMSAGKAVVSTTIGAQGIRFQPGVHLCIADSAEEMTAALIGLFDKREKLQLMQDDARALSTEIYGNEQVVMRLLDFYRSITHRKVTKNHG